MIASPEHEPCPVCGTSGAARFVSATGMRLYCRACFHGWRPHPESFPYDDVAMCPLGTLPERIDRQVGFFEAHIPGHARILEIGCATGELAAAVRRRLAPDVYDAIELSPAGAVAEARVDRLFRTPLTDLRSAGVINGGYDAVLMSHVLEHIPDPGAEIEAISKVLAPSGVLFVEVPNRSGNLVLPFDDNRSHIHFFSASSLTRLLSTNGLEVIEVRSGARLDARYSDSLQIIARPFDLPDMSWRLSGLEAIGSEGDLVVWGAGSLVEEVLANFVNLERIACFVDRDPRKHGMTIRGKPVIAPEALPARPATILVNSIDFAGAIVADIKRVHPGVAHRIAMIGDLIDRSPRTAPGPASASSDARQTRTHA